MIAPLAFNCRKLGTVLTNTKACCNNVGMFEIDSKMKLQQKLSVTHLYVTIRMTEPPTNVVTPNISSNPPNKKPTAAVSPVVSVTQDKSDANSTVSVNEVAPNPPSAAAAAAAAVSHSSQQQPIQQVNL